MNHCTEVRFASFLSGGFTTMSVISQPERKLAKRTFVHCLKQIWAIPPIVKNDDEHLRFNEKHVQYCCVENGPEDCVDATTDNGNATIAKLIKVS